MKNKNTDKSANELSDLIIEVERKNNGDYPYASALGVMLAIMEWSRGSSDKRSLQSEINYQYNRYEQILLEFKTKDLQKVCNEAKLEELYA